MCTFEKNEKNQAVITVTVSGEEFEKAIEQAYHKTAGRYAIAGFPQGQGSPQSLLRSITARRILRGRFQ